MKMTLNVNGKPAAITADDPQMPLWYALRDDLGLHGPRFGCGLGQRPAPHMAGWLSESALDIQ